MVDKGWDVQLGRWHSAAPVLASHRKAIALGDSVHIKDTGDNITFETSVFDVSGMEKVPRYITGGQHDKQREDQETATVVQKAHRTQMAHLSAATLSVCIAITVPIVVAIRHR
ncbi:hypothetical protein E2562_019052 [Oryza meyeriana var. granulata]|uniref:Uncharacterized protein n=1 Tax=Oryza meyeriana var. granulata TaxID=110450 RepID=A0A6G1EMY5_9ORYZ|nr:hypothetical protein E2562_019052 [Oryza meyeriana var. granulata]